MVRRLSKTGRQSGSKVPKKAIGYQTTAMPMVKNPRLRVIPRSLGYSPMPETLRVKIADFSILPRALEIDQDTGIFAPNVFTSDPHRVSLFGLTNPFQFNRLMQIYSSAQVESVTYRLEVQDTGYRRGDDQDTEVTQANSLNDGLEVASVILPSGDADTFAPNAQPINNQPIIQSLAQLPHARFNRLHVGGNRDTVIHFQSLDLNSYFKEPNSQLRRITSTYFRPGPPPADMNTIITIPPAWAQSPTFLVVVSNDTPADQLTITDQHFFKLTCRVEYNISFSELHVNSYGQSFPTHEEDN